ncbi:MAG: FAD-binding oxidoreductase, partial [Woeseiaceae bacterium]|nr:FAD-binding oxidoreductase [Woeseiaceae bacterium]
IEYQAFGNAEVAVAHSPRAFAGLREQFEALELLGVDAELVTADAARERFYDSTEQYGALALRPTFGLHPLRYCRGLAAAAARRGARLHAHSRVIEWTNSPHGGHTLVTRGGTLRARRVVFATNGFIDESLHRSFYGRSLPIISAIIVTRPLTADEIEAQGWRTEHPCYNTRRVLNYYRLLPDGRFMFGGRGQGLGAPADESRGYDDLAHAMRAMWPRWARVEIDYRWHGLICYTGSLRPGIGVLDDDDSVWFGFGYHGNGVNNATWAGKQLADWIGTGRRPQAVPEFVASLPNRFPLPKMRTASLRLALKLASWRDRRR